VACRLLLTGSVIPYVPAAGSLADRGSIALVCAEALPFAVNRPIIRRAESVARPYDANIQAGGFRRERYVVI
jgi:hypothetical protein